MRNKEADAWLRRFEMTIASPCEKHVSLRHQTTHIAIRNPIIVFDSIYHYLFVLCKCSLHHRHLTAATYTQLACRLAGWLHNSITNIRYHRLSLTWVSQTETVSRFSASSSLFLLHRGIICKCEKRKHLLPSSSSR